MAVHHLSIGLVVALLHLCTSRMIEKTYLLPYSIPALQKSEYTFSCGYIAFAHVFNDRMAVHRLSTLIERIYAFLLLYRLLRTFIIKERTYVGLFIILALHKIKDTLCFGSNASSHVWIDWKDVFMAVHHLRTSKERRYALLLLYCF